MWLIAFWGWLKNYWVWILFPVGIVLFALGRLTSEKKPPDVVSPELVDAANARRLAQEEADDKLLSAMLVRHIKLNEVLATHEVLIGNLTDSQREKVKELESDPEELNEFLCDVGKSVRG